MHRALTLLRHSNACTPIDTTVERVAMAGDGVNGAPALAQADLSISAAGGTYVAGETSDVVLTRSDLTLIAWFIGLSRRTRRVILENPSYSGPAGSLSRWFRPAWSCLSCGRACPSHAVIPVAACSS